MVYIKFTYACYLQNSSDASTHAELRGFRPHNSYEISVSTQTRAGNGEQYSLPVIFTTNESGNAQKRTIDRFLGIKVELEFTSQPPPSSECYSVRCSWESDVLRIGLEFGVYGMGASGSSKWRDSLLPHPLWRSGGGGSSPHAPIHSGPHLQRSVTRCLLHHQRGGG